MTMKTTIIRQARRFKTPRRITQPKDQFGCVGFTSYGFIQYTDGSTNHVKNPDFNWKKFSK
jgi:hypothetical protein